LEQKQNEIEKITQYRACCNELNKKLDELKKRLELAKKETNNKSGQLEREIRDIQNRKKTQESKIKDFKEELEKHAENIQKVKENCERHCENKHNHSNKSTSKEGNNNVTYDSTRLDNLEKSIEYLIENHKSFNEMIEALTQCQHIQDNLTKTEEKLNQIQNEENKCQTDQNKDQTELQLHIKDINNCCKKLDSLAKNNQDLYETITHMNNSYIDHIFKLDADLKDLQNHLNEGLKKLNLENSNKQLDNKVDAIIKKLDVIQKTVNDSDNKLREVQASSMKNFHELKKLILNQKNALEKFSKHAEQRYNDLNTKTIVDKPVDKEDRIDRLERQQDKISEDIDKALHLKKRIEDLEKQLKVALDNLKLNLSEYGKCTSKCKLLDNIDDFIDRIEDLEAINNKKLFKEKPNTPKNHNQSQIGGVDFE